MAKIEFHNRDSGARGYKKAGEQEYPHITDALELLAAAAQLCGIREEGGRLVVADSERAQKINPRGSVCRIVIDVR